MDEDKEYFFITEPERLMLRGKRKVMITGEIEAGTASEFVADMELLMDKEDPITIIISSNGGNAEYGNACIRSIMIARKKGIKVIGTVHGQAMSMAFFILQACTERVMGSFDTIMAHGLTATSMGDMKNREAEDKLLKFFQGEYAKMVAARCKNKKYSVAYWKKLLTDNTPRFFNSNESLELGLVDRIE